MKRLDLDSYFLEIAATVGKRSTCSRGQTGCVITKDKHIIATGYNGTPSGEPHEPHKHSKEECKAIHAEINALEQANYNVKGTTIYLTRSPCPTCAAKLVECGIEEVIFSDKHSTLDESMDVLLKGGILPVYKPHITYEEV